MKIIISATLEKSELIVDNRPALVSLFKKAFSQYNKNLYDKYYVHTKKQKNFCFSLKLNNPTFNEDVIILGDNEVFITLHTYSFEDGIDIYNAFCFQRGKDFSLPKNNSLKIKDVSIKNHKNFMANEITIKMYSPLLIRKHANDKDYYLTYADEDFNKYFKMSVQEFLDNENLNICNDINIIPVNPKKTVPISFGYKVTGNIGVYKLTGNPELLNLLYQSGIGSRRSQGFGLFEII